MVDIIIDVFNFIFTVILVGVFLAWLSLMHSMYQSFTKTPFLDKFDLTYPQYIVMLVLCICCISTRPHTGVQAHGGPHVSDGQVTISSFPSFN